MTEALYLVKIIDFQGIHNSGGACSGGVVVGGGCSFPCVPPGFLPYNVCLKEASSAKMNEFPEKT